MWKTWVSDMRISKENASAQRKVERSHRSDRAKNFISLSELQERCGRTSSWMSGSVLFCTTVRRTPGPYALRIAQRKVNMTDECPRDAHYYRPYWDLMSVAIVSALAMGLVGAIRSHQCRFKIRVLQRSLWLSG